MHSKWRSWSSWYDEAHEQVFWKGLTWHAQIDIHPCVAQSACRKGHSWEVWCCIWECEYPSLILDSSIGQHLLVSKNALHYPAAVQHMLRIVWIYVTQLHISAFMSFTLNYSYSGQRLHDMSQMCRKKVYGMHMRRKLKITRTPHRASLPDSIRCVLEVRQEIEVASFFFPTERLGYKLCTSLKPCARS